MLEAVTSSYRYHGMEYLLYTCYARDSRYVIHCYHVNHSNKLLMRSWLLYSISGLLLLL